VNALRIGTRKSPLALWQAEHVRGLLGARGQPAELVPITTTGDRIVDRPLAEVGGKGLFVKELEEALRDGRADLAVHSAKDVPYELPDGSACAPFPSAKTRGRAGRTARAALGRSTQGRQSRDQLLATRSAASRRAAGSRDRLRAGKRPHPARPGGARPVRR